MKGNKEKHLSVTPQGRNCIPSSLIRKNQLVVGLSMGRLDNKDEELRLSS